MKKRIKRLIAGISVLAVAAGSVILSAFGLNAGAASSEPTVTSFATKNQLMTVFDPREPFPGSDRALVSGSRIVKLRKLSVVQ